MTKNVSIINSIMGQYPRLSQEDTAKLCEKIQQGNLSARNTLALSNIGLIVYACKKMHVKDEDFEDVVEECFAVYLEKAQYFIPSKGTFSVYMYSWLKDCIKKYSTKGLSVHTMSVLSKINNAKAYYISQFNSLPSIGQLVSLTGLSAKVIKNTENNLNFANTVSLDAPCPSVSGDKTCTLGDLVSSHNSINENFYKEPAEKFLDDELRQIIYAAMQKALSPLERQVILEHFGFNGKELSYSQIGSKLGYCRQGINAITVRALGKLKNYLQQNYQADGTYCLAA